MSMPFLFVWYLFVISDIHASPSTRWTNRADRDANTSTQEPTPDAANDVLPFNVTALSFPLNATAQNLVGDAAIYRKYIEKGVVLYSRLLGGCASDIVKAPTVTDLIDADWAILPFPVWSGARSYSGLLPDVLDGIGAGYGKDYFFINAINKQTHSTYRSSYSPANGLIGAVELAHTANDPVFWSDVAFAMWTYVCESAGVQPTNLKYLVQAYIVNDATLAILNEATPQDSGVFEFTPHGDRAEGFFAFLASPNGAGGAYLLMQHKAALGLKTVTKITVLKEGPHAPDIIYEVGDVRVEADTMAVGGRMASACGAWKRPLIANE